MAEQTQMNPMLAEDMGKLIIGDLFVRHPFRPNQVAKPGDVDDLVTLYETMQREYKQLESQLHTIRQLLTAMSMGDKKTRRLQGKSRRVKLTMPDDSWDQDALRSAWFDFPQYAEKALRIDRLSPRLIELKKWENMSGAKDFEVCKKLVLGARRPASRPASITIEE